MEKPLPPAFSPKKKSKRNWKFILTLSALTMNRAPLQRCDVWDDPTKDNNGKESRENKLELGAPK